MKADAPTTPAGAGPAPIGWLIEGVVAIVLLLIAVSAMLSWRHADASNRYPEALLVLPPPEPDGGYLAITADYLNHTRPDRGFESRAVRYVSAAEVSTGPWVVSVYPVDALTWLAVAQGADRKCYVVELEHPAPSTWTTTYGILPRGTACRGSSATTASAADSVPPEG